MKIGLYISSSCAKDPLAYAFANLLSEGLGNRVQTLTRHDKLDPTLDLVVDSFLRQPANTFHLYIPLWAKSFLGPTLNHLCGLYYKKA